MVLARATKRGKNSKGGDFVSLYLSAEETDKLITAATREAASDPGKGLKLTVHTNVKDHEGRKFDSSFMFIKVVGDAPNTAPASPKKFVPKTIV